MRRRYSIPILAIFSFILIAACSKVPLTLTDTPTIQSIHIEETATPSMPITTNEIKTSTSVSITQLDFSGLPVQQYLIYTEERFQYNSINSPVDFYVNMQSLDGKYQRSLFHDFSASGEFPNMVLLSTDQKHLIIFDYYPKPNAVSAEPMMFNLQTGKMESISAGLPGCAPLSYDATNQKWLGQCGNSPEILLDQQNSPAKSLTNCHAVGDVCRSPQWSPDSSWLSFYRGQTPRGGGKTIEYGLQVIKSDCVENGIACTSNYQLSDGWDIYAWSPDSKYIASSFAPGYDPIYIFEVKQEHLVLNKKIDPVKQGFPGDSLIWSSDGKNLAFGDGNNIFLVDVNSLDQQLIIQKNDAQLKIVGIAQVGFMGTP